MIRYKQIAIIIFLLIAILASYYMPRTKYAGTNFISSLQVPFTFTEWHGTDVSNKLNINAANTNYNFINKAIAYNYINSKGHSLLFIVLDAGNFHHPEVCFTGAGYEIKELPDSKITLSGRSFKTHTLFIKRGNDSYLSFYWIVIDKGIIHEWIEQKFKQLIYSLFNKKRIGLMVRIDIPTQEENIGNAMTLATQFIRDLNDSLEPEDADYILGTQ